jgi:hypothetical protein
MLKPVLYNFVPGPVHGVVFGRKIYALLALAKLAVYRILENNWKFAHGFIAKLSRDLNISPSTCRAI